MSATSRSALRVTILSSACAAWLGAAPPAHAAAAVATPPPISLTASDGAGLELVSLTAEAAVEDPLAFTELHLTFRNPENRVREGRFRITLPPGAAVSRFAMRIGDRFQEGEVVEQQAARVAYEDFLHRRQDPALLEAEAGNEFSARVFPIPPAGTKEIVISYAEELPRSGAPYRLPLAGLPRLGTLAIHVRVGQSETRFERRDVTPARDFELAHAAGGRLGLRDDNLVVARVVPFTGSVARAELGALDVLVDTSASRALGLDQQTAALGRLFAALAKDGDPEVTVKAFDQDVAPLFSGKASAAAAIVGPKLHARGALGASDLERALRSIEAEPARSRRVLVVTDGVATAGATGADALRARVAALGARGVRRLDVVAMGGIRDDVLLSRLVTAGLAQDGVVADGAAPAAEIVGRLTRATRSGIALAVDGAGWVWPRVVDGVQPGDELLVYADLPAGQPFRLRIGGAPVTLTGALAPAPRPLLERAWVRARIAGVLAERDRVAATDRDLGDALRKQAIELSIRNRVLCPFTSLLVLETEQDYARFGIERRALADILTVGPRGIELLHRTEIAAPFAVAAPRGARKGEVAPLESKKAKAEAADDLDAESLAAADENEHAGGRSDESAAEPRREVALSPSPPPSAASAPALEDFAPASSVANGLTGAGAGGAHANAFRARAMAPAAPRMMSLASPAPIAAPVAAPIAARAAPMAAEEQPGPSPVTGPFKEVRDLLAAQHLRAARARAVAWRTAEPGDVLALVALGECDEALGDRAAAARAYGSIIDLYPGRADLRRFAGERLERLDGSRALELAIDTYRQAVTQRPDHPAGHHLLAFALLKAGHPGEAFDALAAGVAQPYPAGRFAGVDRILREDLGLIAAAWTRREPARAAEIATRLAGSGGTPETGPSIRFILNWETDANDVDFHIHDGHGGHAFYSAPHLPSGGDLYADVTTGYGPECFTIRAPNAGRATPYRLQAHYYSRGPMGYGMGKLQIIDHDGHGHLRFDERPFVIMQDQAFVDLGSAGRATTAASHPVALGRRPTSSRVWTVEQTAR